MRHNVRDKKGRFCKKSVEPVTKGYKGFSKGLRCRNKQYKVGETYEEHGKKICEEGMMHFCEKPIDVLDFYTAVNPYTGEPNEFAKVEAIGRIIKDDVKCATNKLRIVRKISLKELIEAATKTRDNSPAATAVNWSNTTTAENWSNAMTTGDQSDAVTLGDRSYATTAGEHSNAATAGYHSHAATSGRFSSAAAVGACSHAITTGLKSRAATTGDHSLAMTADDLSAAATVGYCSNAATTGSRANATSTGKFSHATTLGHYSNATTAGDCSHATTKGIKSHAVTVGFESDAAASGEFSIAASLGAASKAKAALDGWIVLAEYDSEDRPMLVKAAKVDGQKIKANTFYKLKNGEFVEA